VDERVRQRAIVLDFLQRHVPGIEPMPGVTELAESALGVAAAS
jgi:hypothetical protein